MIERIDNNQVPDIFKEFSAKQPGPSRGSANKHVDASLQVTYDSLIEKAQQIPPEDANAVQRARRILLSGRLDSPENIRAAAENIVRFGI